MQAKINGAYSSPAHPEPFIESERALISKNVGDALQDTLISARIVVHNTNFDDICGTCTVVRM
jgi:hypothetical protein